MEQAGCRRDPVLRRCVELETVEHHTVPERYYLALNRWHDLTITSYPLDSWKHFKDRVEFKFDINATTGMGLSFIVRFPNVEE